MASSSSVIPSKQKETSPEWVPNLYNEYSTYLKTRPDKSKQPIASTPTQRYKVKEKIKIVRVLARQQNGETLMEKNEEILQMAAKQKRMDAVRVATHR